MTEIAWATLPVISILGFAFGLRETLRLPLSLTLLPSIGIVVLVLLASSLIGLLYETWLLVLGAGLILLVWRGLPGLWAGAWRDLAFAAFLGVALGLYLYLRPLELISWDEFSHWGTFSKFLLLSDRLPRLLGEVIFISYPPGLGIFSYFITRGFGFNEGFLLFGGGLLQATALLTFLAPLRWRDLPSGVLLAGVLILIGSVVGLAGYNWTTVTADNTLAIVGAAAFVVYLAGGRGSGALVGAGLVMALTCSIKDSGNLLACTIGSAILVDQLLKRWCEGAGLDALSLLRLLAALALPSAGMILAWRIHVSGLGQSAVFQTGFSDIRARMVEPGFGEYALSIARDYWAALLGGRVIGNLPVTVPVWLAVLGLLASNAILLRWRYREAGAISLVHGVFLAGFVVYAVSLLFFYIFAFVPYEARLLAGMDRYLSTYLIMWFLCGLATLIWTGTDWASRFCLAAWSGVILLIAGPAFWAGTSTGPRGDAFATDVLQNRKLVRTALSQSIGKLPPEASVYVIWNGVSGLPYYISHFELKPRRTSFPRYLLMREERFTDLHLWCHSLGPSRFPNDIWSCDWTLEELVTAIEGYDFLFVNAADEAFITRYGSLFPEGSLQSGDTMFRIRREGGAVRMEPVKR